MTIVKTLAASAALAMALTTMQPQTAEAGNGRWIAGLALGAVATGLLWSAQRHHYYDHRYPYAYRSYGQRNCHWHHGRRFCGPHRHW